MSIQNVIKNIQDIMWKDAGVDGDAQRLSQLVWMLFLKIFDDKEQEYELVDPKYKSPIPVGVRPKEIYTLMLLERLKSHYHH